MLIKNKFDSLWFIRLQQYYIETSITLYMYKSDQSSAKREPAGAHLLTLALTSFSIVQSTGTKPVLGSELYDTMVTYSSDPKLA